MGNTLLEWAKECFANDRYATAATGAIIEWVQLGDSCASVRCALRLHGDHRNARGAVMGGVFFTLADFACAIAMNLPDAARRLQQSESGDDLYDLHWVSLSSNISFLAQPKGDSLVAQTRCIRHGRTTCLYEVEIVDNERVVAVVTTNGIRI